jgi:hypothetical protein
MRSAHPIATVERIAPAVRSVLPSLMTRGTAIALPMNAPMVKERRVSPVDSAV